MSSPDGRAELRAISIGLRCKDPSALASLYDRLKKFHVSFMRQVAVDRADDLYHDLVLQVVERVGEGQLRNPEALDKYAAVIARRQLFGSYRERYRSCRAVDDAPESIPDHRIDVESAYIKAEQREIALQVLKALRRRDREVLTRFYLDEQPRDQICREMEITPTQFRLLKSRAKERFAELCRERFSKHERAASPTLDVDCGA